MKKSLRNIIIVFTIFTLITGSIWAMGSSDKAEAVSSASTSQPLPPGSTGSTVTVSSTVIESASLSAESVFDYSKKDLTEYTPSDAEHAISLSNESVTISEGGIYLITGTLEDGQLIVNAPKDEDVVLILDGVDITSTDSAAILIEQADKVIIALAEGPENTLTDIDSGTLSDEEKEAEAVIYSKEDITFSGTGSLTITANRNNGIQGKDDVTFMGGTITIASADDGIVGKDSIVIHDGSLLITSGGDGLKSTNEEETEKGNIAIEGGELTVRSKGDALQAAASILITGGEFTLQTGTGTKSDSTSQKGIKAAQDLTVTGGTFTIIASDDALHSNVSLQIDGGDFTIATADDAVHSDETLVINDGTITITQAYEGIESALIALNGGSITMITSDDGINASVATESSEPFAPGAKPSQGGSALLQITGGIITITAEGDGLDSNGSILMSGGTVTVNGPTSSGNGSLDYDVAFTLTGGTLITAGSSGMVQSPSDSSTQNSVLMTFTVAQAAGCTVTLLDGSGKSIATVNPTTRFQSLLISSEPITDGETYTLKSESGVEVTFTASGTTTWLNESGVTTAQSGMAGGRGGFPGGGMRPSQGGFRN